MSRWQPADPQKFVAAYLAGATDAELAQLCSATPDKVKHHIRIQREAGALPARGEFIPSELVGEIETASDHLDLKVLKKLKVSPHDLTITDLANEFDVSPKRIENVIVRLSAQHYLVNQHDEFVGFDAATPGNHTVHYYDYRDGNRLKFGVVADTHLCSNHERLDILHTLYDIFELNGVTTVYHLGNIVDGEGPVNRNELKVHGIGNQAQYFVENYPFREGITTYYITGQCHEGWWRKREGLDIGEYMEDKARRAGRTDLVYMGHIECDIDIPADNGFTRIKLQHPGGGAAYSFCVDSETEILTERGWQTFPELDRDVRVATLNRDTMQLEWQLPIEYIDDEYIGEMLYFNAKRYNMMVTPNHRMFCQKAWYNWASWKSTNRAPADWQFVEATNLRKSKKNWCILRTIPNWVGEPVDAVDLPVVSVEPHGKLKYDYPSLPAVAFFKFMGWWLAEGHLSDANQSVEITQITNQAYREEIIECCRELGYEPYVTDKVIKVSSKQLYRYLKDANYGKSHEKYVPQVIKNATPELIAVFLDTFFKGDGTLRKDGSWDKVSTVSKVLADDLQELLLKLGMSAVVGVVPGAPSTLCPGSNNRTNYVISVSASSVSPTIWSDPEVIDYNGRVYCVRVPNEVFLMRRRGKVAWSGNSYKPQKVVEALSGGFKPNILLLGHWHKAGHFFIRNVHVVQGGCVQGQSSFMRTNSIAAHLGGYIIELVQGSDGSVLEFNPRLLPFYDVRGVDDCWVYEP